MFLCSFFVFSGVVFCVLGLRPVENFTLSLEPRVDEGHPEGPLDRGSLGFRVNRVALDIKVPPLPPQVF